ncbi:DUF6457 domain-containing protein [Streptomyces albus]|uniref:DUF6457 domain-containing protein n=1 Tax=Streptomyces albus TaxID=1888 RepID=UPI00099F0A73|nr:DUF6457 domain-containing protein [Streptomyces albus]
MTQPPAPPSAPRQQSGPGGTPRPYAALVLAGGGARRLGGVDKPAVTVGGRTLLDRVLAACADAAATVVVGPRRPSCRPVLWAREDPPGGGPLAALHAGLETLGEDGGGPDGAAGRTPVLVVSADLPFLDAATVGALVTVPEDAEGVVLHDGRDQPLLAAYRMEPLRRELALLRTEYGHLSGLPLRLVLQGLRLHRVAALSAPSLAAAAFDCDTWDDIVTARARIREHDRVLDEWIAAAKAELGIELNVDTTVLLDLARDAAHGVARPAAPLTTFLAGYAAGRAGGSSVDVDEAAAALTHLARRWAAEADETGGRGGTTDAGEASGTNGAGKAGGADGTTGNDETGTAGNTGER